MRTRENTLEILVRTWVVEGHESMPTTVRGVMIAPLSLVMIDDSILVPPLSGANMTGPLSPVQLSSLSKYPLIILGWQHQIWWSNFSRISHAQLSELRKIKSMYPTTKTYAYLPLSWAPPMWENIRNIVTDPSICQRSGRFYDYFLQSRAKEEGGGGEGLPECVRGDREEHPLYSDTFCGQVVA
eukprot:815086-Amorphochlora_amoeboformis.AAC.1